MSVTRWMLCVSSISLASGLANGQQEYPNKAIRIVTSGVGGTTDLAARQIARGISGPLGQQVIVDNRPSGIIPGETVANASPDGYTLLLGFSGLWTGQLLGKVPYDAVKDFLPISWVTTAPLVLVVHPSLPVKSVKELIALAKSRPGELNYASGSTGGGSHLAGELLNSLAGVKIVRVPYKSDSSQISDQLSGEVQLGMNSTPSVIEHMKSGRLRALAVTSARRSELHPGLPAIGESLPGYESASIQGVLAPARTPPLIITRLNQEVVRAIKQPEVKQFFFNLGIETVGSSPDEFAAAIKSDMARTSRLIKDAWIKVN